MTDRDELEAIVRELAAREQPEAFLHCALCHAPGRYPASDSSFVIEHRDDCPWRRAREWVARQGGERG